MNRLALLTTIHDLIADVLNDASDPNGAHDRALLQIVDDYDPVLRSKALNELATRLAVDVLGTLVNSGVIKIDPAGNVEQRPGADPKLLDQLRSGFDEGRGAVTPEELRERARQQPQLRKGDL